MHYGEAFLYRRTAIAAVCIVGLASMLPAEATGQVLDRLKDSAENAATREAQQQVDRLLREAIRCALDDPACQREAEAAGEDVIFLDANGEVIADEDGVPITDVETARNASGNPSAAEIGEIRALSRAWLENTDARNAAAVASLFAPDGIVFQSGTAPVIGPAAIREDVERDWAANPEFTVDWTSISVEVASSGDLAWERGRWTFDGDGPGPETSVSGEYVTVYEKVDGEWRIAADIGVPTGAARGD